MNTETLRDRLRNRHILRLERDEWNKCIAVALAYLVVMLVMGILGWMGA